MELSFVSLDKIKVLKDILHQLERQSLHDKIVLENILYHQGCSGNGSGCESENEGEGDEMADVDVDQLIKKLTEHLQDMRLNKKKALKDILYWLERCTGSGSGSEGKGDKMADADVDQLTRKLTEHLQDKRYFIIIDDLWSTEAWSTMKCYFPENNLGSRIMTLTRNETVAKFCSGPTDRVFKIRLLNDVDSKTLFFKEVFPAADVCPPDLMDVSTQIMRKCGGLPLAIVTIANRLLSKPITGEVWEKFGLDWKPTELDWGLRLTWPVDWRPIPHLYSMTKTLNLSYKDLPQHLKICFLYLSIFPEDYKIDKERLLRRWIAEGFIGEEGDLSKDETANSYFNELISRNMIQPLDVDFNGLARSCTLHPVMFNFVASKAIISAEFVTVLHTQQQDVKHKKACHLSLHCDNKNSSATVQGDTMNFSQARSFTLFGHANGMPPLAMLKVIRVLDLEDSKELVEQCLEGLCNLLLLKYLRLKGTDVSELPEHIGDLQSLETLDVRSTKVQELPPDIVILEKLVHLLAGFVKLPVGIRNMRALQTLSCVDIGKNSISALQELGELNNLRDLAMFCDATGTSSDQLDCVLSSLAKLFALRCLTVVGRGGSSVDFLASLSPPPSLLERFRLEESKLRRIPGWMARCSNLIEVDISIEEIGEDGLTILQGLPRLLRLCLSLLFIPQEPVTFRVDRFQSLKELIFQCSFPSLIFEPGTLLKLEGLELRFEKGLAEESIGVSGIECLPSLKHVFIEFSHWDAGATATVAAVRNAAAMIQPKHPAVTVKGEEKSD